jgi:hypothetical protein
MSRSERMEILHEGRRARRPVGHGLVLSLVMVEEVSGLSVR